MSNEYQMLSQEADKLDWEPFDVLPVSNDTRQLNRNIWNACTLGNFDAVRHYLRQRSADVNALNDHGQTPLMLACRMGHTGIVQLLLKSNKVDVQRFDGDNESALMHACILAENEEIVRLLLDRGASVQIRNRRTRQTPLHLACQAGNAAIVDLLLGKESPIEDSDTRGSSPLFEACRHGHDSVVKKLLDAGANVNSLHGGKSALDVAVQVPDNLVIIRLLLAHGAEVDARVVDQIKDPLAGQELLWHACSNFNISVVQTLGRQGLVDMEATNPERKTPLAMAFEHIQEIEGSKLVLAILQPLVEQLIKDQRVDAVVYENQTALHVVAKYGYTDIAKTLLDQRADIDKQDSEGWTPLLHSSHSGHADMVQLLLKREANVQLESSLDYTPLLAAIRKGYRDIEKMLREHGATVKKIYIYEHGNVILLANSWQGILCKMAQQRLASTGLFVFVLWMLAMFLPIIIMRTS